MKKGIIIGIIIGLIIGLVIGGISFSKKESWDKFSNKEILEDMTGVVGLRWFSLEKTFESVKIKEFEIDGLNDNVVYSGCFEGICGNQAIYIGSCEMSLPEKLGISITDLDFYTCRLGGVHRDDYSKSLLGDCKCFYKL